MYGRELDAAIAAVDGVWELWEWNENGFTSLLEQHR